MSGSKKDHIYNTPQTMQPFRFDERVAAVFPDMIQRSVPGYDQIIDGIQQFAGRFVAKNTKCYDLGCSLGAASLAMSLGIEQDGCEIIAIDNSAAMVNRAKLFVEAYHHKTPISVLQDDIQNQPFENASMVVLNFTLQFIEVAQRQPIIDAIFQGLNHGGVLILSEKVSFQDEKINQLFIEQHHNFKRANGYSDLEISQKRNALENVLLPEAISTHRERLVQAGFNHIDVWHQQLNFCSIVAIK
jgi:tRNA (cmo5U34)-methyltransferase